MQDNRKAKIVPKSILPKILYSGWFYTINTNKPDSDELFEKFDKIIAHIFSPEHTSEFVIGNGADIVSVRRKGVYEIQSSTGFLHTHFSIFTCQRSKILLDYGKITNAVNAALELPEGQSVYAKPKTCKNTEDPLNDYMMKYGGKIKFFTATNRGKEVALKGNLNSFFEFIASSRPPHVTTNSYSSRRASALYSTRMRRCDGAS